MATRALATTRWSLIARAGSQTDDSAAALAELCEQWRPAILRFLRREVGAAQAEDLTQGFFLHLLEQGLIGRADAAQGRFRGFLYTALRHWCADQARRQGAHKRGGTAVEVPDSLLTQLPSDDEPSQWFDRCWAECLLQRALRALEAEAAANGRADLFREAAPFLTETPDNEDYRCAAERLQLRSNTFAVAVGRLRKRLQALVMQAVGDTTDDAESARQELRYLRSSLGPP